MSPYLAKQVRNEENKLFSDTEDQQVTISLK